MYSERPDLCFFIVVFVLTIEPFIKSMVLKGIYCSMLFLFNLFFVDDIAHGDRIKRFGKKVFLPSILSQVKVNVFAKTHAQFSTENR